MKQPLIGKKVIGTSGVANNRTEQADHETIGNSDQGEPSKPSLVCYTKNHFSMWVPPLLCRHNQSTIFN
jgi:hypothetical protein